MIAPARLAAYDVLRAVNTGRADLSAALARVRSRLDDERDRALASEIATGTLRWQGACDAVIAAFAGRPPAKLDPEVLDILRMTAFQLLHLDRIPASAAVNDAVDLAGKAGKQSAAGLVNAVLRRISRERAHLPLPPRPPDAGVNPRFSAASPSRSEALAYLSTTLSHPEWLVARWLDLHGFEAAEAWAIFDNSPATLTLRANTLRISRDALAERLAALGVETEPARFAPQGLSVRGGNPVLTPLASEGLFAVQDESSQLVAELTAAAPGERILDACASPGGKATAMAAAMENGGRSERDSTAFCSMRPARGSGRSVGIRTFDGADRQMTSSGWRRSRSACSDALARLLPPGDGSSTRPVPASPRKTRPWSAAFSKSIGTSRPRRNAYQLSSRGSSRLRDISGPFHSATSSNRSLPPCW